MDADSIIINIVERQETLSCSTLCIVPVDHGWFQLELAPQSRILINICHNSILKMNWLVFNNSQLLHLNEYVKQLEMNQHVFNDIDNVHSSLFPFVCKSAMNWTKSNVNRLETLVSLLSCYVTLPPPYLVFGAVTSNQLRQH